MTSDLMNAARQEPPLHDTAVRILHAAGDLFAAQGFRATTVKEITLRCGITQGALYVYFPSKDAVLEKLIKVAYEQLMQKLTEAEAEAGSADPARWLTRLVRGFLEYGTRYTVLARVADREWTALGGAEREAVMELRREVRSRFEAAIRFGFADGTFTMHGDRRHQVRFLATAIIDMCAGVFHHWYTGGSVSDESLIARYEEVTLGVVGAAPASRHS